MNTQIHRTAEFSKPDSVVSEEAKQRPCWRQAQGGKATHLPDGSFSTISFPRAVIL